MRHGLEPGSEQGVRVTLKGITTCVVILLDAAARCELERGRHGVFRGFGVSLCG